MLSKQEVEAMIKIDKKAVNSKIFWIIMSSFSSQEWLNGLISAHSLNPNTSFFSRYGKAARLV